MTKILRIAGTLAVLTALLVAVPAGADTLLIRNAAIVSPERAAPTPPTDVWIRDGVINAIGVSAQAEPDRIIDAAGLYLAPGLIDGHAVLHNPPGLSGIDPDIRDRLEPSYFRQMPRSYLYFGFTTLVQPDAVREFDRLVPEADAAPRIVTCGQAVALPDGYAASKFHFGIALSLYDNFLYDHYTAGYLPPRHDKFRHTPQAVMGELNRRGAACAFLYYEDGAAPGQALAWELPSAGILREVGEQAARYNLPFAVQARTLSGYRAAIDAGAQIIAHGLWDDGTAGSQASSAQLQSLLDALAIRNIGVMPTLSATDALIALFEDAVIGDPALGHALPEDYLAALKGTLRSQKRDAFLLRQGEDTDPQAVLAGLRAAEATSRQTARSLAQRNARLLFGTAAVADEGIGHAPGYTGWRELRAWQDAGIAPADIFAAATVNTARAFGVAQEIGTVEVGKRADLLLLSANPQESTAAYDQIVYVILNGLALERARLSARAD